MHHQIGAQLDGPLKIRRHEGVIDAQIDRLARALCLLAAHRTHGADVGQLHQGVGRRLDMDQACLRSKGATDVLRVAGVYICKGDAVVRHDLVKEPWRAAIDIRTTDDVVAGFQHRDQR
jgi:hypothetical protein